MRSDAINEKFFNHLNTKLTMEKESEVVERDTERNPRYLINIEGDLKPWNEDTITTEQIIRLGGWDSSQGVIMIDLLDNSEVTLRPGQVIHVRSGLGFSKKISFKRG